MNLRKRVIDLKHAVIKMARGWRFCECKITVRIAIVAVMAGWFGSPGLLPAMDKRTPLDILPYGGQAIQIVSGYIHQHIEQSTVSGNKLAEVENAVFAVKTLYRAAPIRRVEIAAEVPYLLHRSQRQTTVRHDDLHV